MKAVLSIGKAIYCLETDIDSFVICISLTWPCRK